MQLIAQTHIIEIRPTDTGKEIRLRMASNEKGICYNTDIAIDYLDASEAKALAAALNQMAGKLKK